MRILILALLILGISLFPAHAEDKVTPRETVEQLYHGMEASEDNAEIVDIPLPMTAELGDLMADDQAYATSKGTGIGRLDFDWMVNGQDARITNLEIQRVMVTPQSSGEPAREIIFAQFDNFDDPTRIAYYWRQDATRGWVIEDVTGWSKDGLVWTLSLLLKYGQ